MPFDAGQDIFELSYKEAIYSGVPQAKPAPISDLIEDYKYYDLRVSSLLAETGLLHTPQAKAEAVQPVPESTSAYEYLKLDEIIAPFLERRPVTPIQRRIRTFTPLQEWEGYVTAITDENFVARIASLGDRSEAPEEEATFSLQDLRQSEQKEIEVGSIIRWVVGLERQANDMRQRVSRVHLRRVYGSSPRQIEAARREARKFLEDMNWDDPS